MWYLMHENNQQHYVEEGSDRIVRVIDPTTNEETLRVTFTPQDNGRVLMKTKYPLTYMYADKKMSAPKDAYYYFSQNREVVLLSDSAETPRITVRMVKLDPQDWPTTPPPEDKTRAPTLEYEAAPSKVRSPTLECEPVRNTPAPPVKQPKQQPKKRKRSYPGFFMC